MVLQSAACNYCTNPALAIRARILYLQLLRDKNPALAIDANILSLQMLCESTMLHEFTARNCCTHLVFATGSNHSMQPLALESFTQFTDFVYCCSCLRSVFKRQRRCHACCLQCLWCLKIACELLVFRSEALLEVLLAKSIIVSCGCSLHCMLQQQNSMFAAVSSCKNHPLKTVAQIMYVKRELSA